MQQTTETTTNATANGRVRHRRTDRPVPRNVRDRASYALSFIMRFGGRRSPKSYIVCSNAPQWVLDVINVATNAKGFTDQQRQEFVVDALRRIEKGRFAGESVGRGPSSQQLRTWANSSVDRSRYADFSRGAGNEIETLSLGYHAERAEVMIQVLDHLTTDPYDGIRSFSFTRFQQEVRPDGTTVE